MLDCLNQNFKSFDFICRCLIPIYVCPRWLVAQCPLILMQKVNVNVILVTRGLQTLWKHCKWISLLQAFGLRGHIIYLRQIFPNFWCFCHQGDSRSKVLLWLDASNPDIRNDESQYRVNMWWFLITYIHCQNGGYMCRCGVVCAPGSNCCKWQCRPEGNCCELQLDYL